MHHAEGLRVALKSRRLNDDERERLVAGLMSDYRDLDLDEADRAMLDYTDKLTRTPWEMEPEDAARLRDAGFDDRGIHDICAIAAYFNFVNRVADGLGVELETGD